MGRLIPAGTGGTMAQIRRIATARDDLIIEERRKQAGEGCPRGADRRYVRIRQPNRGARTVQIGRPPGRPAAFFSWAAMPASRQPSRAGSQMADARASTIARWWRAFEGHGGPDDAQQYVKMPPVIGIDYRAQEHMPMKTT